MLIPISDFTIPRFLSSEGKFLIDPQRPQVQGSQFSSFEDDSKHNSQFCILHSTTGKLFLAIFDTNGKACAPTVAMLQLHD